MNNVLNLRSLQFFNAIIIFLTALTNSQLLKNHKLYENEIIGLDQTAYWNVRRIH